MTKNLPWPDLAFILSKSMTGAPMTAVGSAPEVTRVWARRAEVVVLPWVPVTASPWDLLKRSARACEYF